jgi:hypothetical protein
MQLASAESSQARCRVRGLTLARRFVDLGMSPVYQRHITTDQFNRMESFYRLHTRVCDKCRLVQLEDFLTLDTSLVSTYSFVVRGRLGCAISCRSVSQLAHTTRLSKSRVAAAIHYSIPSPRAFPCRESSRPPTWPK